VCIQRPWKSLDFNQGGGCQTAEQSSKQESQTFEREVGYKVGIPMSPGADTPCRTWAAGVSICIRTGRTPQGVGSRVARSWLREGGFVLVRGLPRSFPPRARTKSFTGGCQHMVALVLAAWAHRLPSTTFPAEKKCAKGRGGSECQHMVAQGSWTVARWLVNM
jgi:hypothetical protein